VIAQELLGKLLIFPADFEAVDAGHDKFTALVPFTVKVCSANEKQSFDFRGVLPGSFRQPLDGS
jgi:hypothetical protein